MERKTYAIVVAGGSGVRMGSAIPKQFLPLSGVPILQRTIERFVEAFPGIRIITVLPSACFQEWKDMCIENHLDYPQTLVAGGLTRFHSVQNALKKVPKGAVVAIHDGVRPLVRVEKLRAFMAAMSTSRAVVPVLPSVDTLKSLEKAADGSLRQASSPDPDRALVWRVQTPQIFLSEDIKEAYSQAFDLSFTDDASVAARKEIPISYVEGDGYNIKITTPDDLALAEALLLLSSR